MIENQRHLFDIPETISYLNCASQSPLLRASVAAGEMGVGRKAHPWGSLREDAARDAEAVRTLFAQLIGATADDIAIVPATSYGMAVAAANLDVEANQEIVILEEQFPSNYYAWRALAERQNAQIVTVPRPGDGDWTAAVLERIRSTTAIAALPPCHWTDGSRLDLVAIGAACRAAGASLAVDATQYVGAAPFDVAEVQPDFMVCSAYKWLLSPYTLAFLYAAPHRQNGIPLELHAGGRLAGPTDHQTGGDYATAFVENARRYDMGERNNFINLPMAAAALRQINDWTPMGVKDGLSPLIGRIADEATDRGFAVPPADHRVDHYIGLRGSEPPAADLADRCAADGVHFSLRSDAIRVSPHLFATEDDITRFFEALSRHHKA